jgi:SAM-dependent methyltransferase
VSAPHRTHNLLDRLTGPETLQLHYDREMQRERQLLARRLPLRSGEVLSVGCGWHPGRHLFPRPAFQLTGADLDRAMLDELVERGELDAARAGRAGSLELPPSSFDVVLYRLVLHHLAYQGPLGPVFEEAARLLQPGGALVAIEPGLWHPVGAALAAANRLGVGVPVHGTPDDIPLSPVRLLKLARAARLEPELHAVTYGWRRLAPGLQTGLRPLDRLGSRPRAAPFGHTLMLLAHKPRC